MREQRDVSTISATPTICASDYKRLTGIATAGRRFRQIPPTVRLLAEELRRASVVHASELPDDVVADALRRYVPGRDLQPGQARRPGLSGRGS